MDTEHLMVHASLGFSLGGDSTAVRGAQIELNASELELL